MVNRPIIQLDTNGFHVTSDNEKLLALRDEFSEKKHFFIDQFLSDKLFNLSLKILPQLDEKIVNYQEGCQEERFKASAESLLIRKLCFIYSNKDFLKTLASLTGLQEILFVTCRMYYVEPDSFHDWHEDSTVKNRKLVMITNLSEELEGCGNFQIRKKGEDTLLGDKAFSKQGETLCFAVEGGVLEHRVMPSKNIRRANLLASFYGY